MRLLLTQVTRGLAKCITMATKGLYEIQGLKARSSSMLVKCQLSDIVELCSDSHIMHSISILGQYTVKFIPRFQSARLAGEDEEDAGLMVVPSGFRL